MKLKEEGGTQRWNIHDDVEGDRRDWEVRWQFAPGWVCSVDQDQILAVRDGSEVRMAVKSEARWTLEGPWEGATSGPDIDDCRSGLCSPSYRRFEGGFVLIIRPAGAELTTQVWSDEEI